MAAAVVPFPPQPAGYSWLDDEPAFDPSTHLALELPASTVTLADLGYPDDVVRSAPTSLAATTPFRVLSVEGAAVLLDTARRLESFTTPNERIERMVRNGCHRSRWLRDLCTSADVTAHLVAIYGVDVAPHPIASQLGHLNFAPSELGAAVDKWHHDTLPLDYVMMVADPTVLDGGDFEWFVGTKEEAAALATAGERPPVDRRTTVEWPGPGYAVALQGDMVVHRGGPLHAPGERITMVNGYVPTDTSRQDHSRTEDLRHVEHPDELARDWARYAAWRSRERLDAILCGLSPTATREVVLDLLADAVDDVVRAIAHLSADDPGTLQHYE